MFFYPSKPVNALLVSKRLNIQYASKSETLNPI